MKINYLPRYFWAVLVLMVALIVSCSYDGRAENKFKLDLPVKCSENENCFVLLYSDRDQSINAKDFECGFMTYDGHKGTDFAISDVQVMKRGIPVVASASGKVLRTRDGVVDKRVRSQDSSQIKGKECGNGVVIDHGDGWQTQYCHLRQGSIQVESGDEVVTGEPLGLVGMSGLASFPHVHLQVSHQGKIVDPFVGLNSADGCQVKTEPLWNKIIPYTPTGLIRAGFATQIPTIDQLWQGDFAQTSLSGNPLSLIFWIQSYGVQPNDMESIELINPQGKSVAKTNQPINQKRKVWFRYVGSKANDSVFSKGNWQGKYQLIRNGKILIDITKNLVLD